MKQWVARRRWNLNHLNVFLLLCLHGYYCSPLNNPKGFAEKLGIGLLPQISPSSLPEAQPPLPPKLSGSCPLNFAALESMITLTAIDCAAPFAKYLANVICCPQLETTLTILVGQHSKDSKNTLALNGTLAGHCLSDFQTILESKGANNTLQRICSLNPSILTEGSCPISNVQEFEATVDSPTLLSSCEKIDPGDECCEQICQNAISEAAEMLAANELPDQSSAKVNDCERVVLRWLASKLDPSGAKEVFRWLYSCKNNRAPPEVSGCLLPTVPSDCILDRTAGIIYACDVIDNIPAPWPSASHLHASSSCNKTVKAPALAPPAASSGGTCVYNLDLGSLAVEVLSTMLLLLLHQSL